MDAAPPPPTDRHIVATTFGLCLVLYLLLSPGRVGGSDTTEMLRLAESLKRGSVAIEPVPGWSFQGPDGRHFSRYGLGYPILLAPFLAAGGAGAGGRGPGPAWVFQGPGRPPFQPLRPRLPDPPRPLPGGWRGGCASRGEVPAVLL